MNDLISRQAALDIIDSELNGWLTDDERLHLEGVGTGIECLPTIDPVKHGKWSAEYGGFGRHIYCCSECRNYSREDFPYCHWCGARMFAKDIDVPNKEGAKIETD